MSPLKLVAADIAGVDRVFKAGGAEAHRARWRTARRPIPRVDKIVGPGSLFVTVAKREVFGDVGIDALYGPSETIVIADDTANPMTAAADLLAQAEHDELATPILLTTSEKVAEAVGARGRAPAQAAAARADRAHVVRGARRRGHRRQHRGGGRARQRVRAGAHVPARAERRGGGEDGAERRRHLRRRRRAGVARRLHGGPEPRHADARARRATPRRSACTTSSR